MTAYTRRPKLHAGTTDLLSNLCQKYDEFLPLSASRGSS